MSLVLKLGPKEKLLFEGGVVVENGDRRSVLRILTPGSRILRVKNCVPQNMQSPTALDAFQLALQRLYLRQESLETVLSAANLLGNECSDVQALVTANMKNPMTGKEIFDAIEATRHKRAALAPVR